MRKKWWWGIAALVALGLFVSYTRWGQELEFLAGGALVNAGYRLQDRLSAYDFAHEEATPEQVYEEFLHQNHLSAAVRNIFPRTVRHPVVALVACMDARLDTNEIAGDTRHYYYVLRLAGSVMSPKEEEMLELAVDHGVKVVVFTTHSDCAAEKTAADPAGRARFPNLVKAVDERAMRFQEFLHRPLIRERTGQGKLLVKWLDLDTETERAEPHRERASR